MQKKKQKMTEKDVFTMSQKELLIRLDERMKMVEKHLELIQQTLIPTSEHLQLMESKKDHETRLDDLEKWKAQVIAQVTVVGSVAGAVVGIISGLISDFLGGKL